MENQIKNLIALELTDVAILKLPNFAYDKVKIFDYQTHYNTGKKFTHKNGDIYAIAYLHALTVKGSRKISETILSNPTVAELKKVIDENRLKQYIHGNTKKYSEWKTGDIGNAYLKKIEDSDDFELLSFANISAEKRIHNF